MHGIQDKEIAFHVLPPLQWAENFNGIGICQKKVTSTLKSPVATCFIKARDPKMPNVDKTRLATLILMGTNVNLLHIVNSRGSKILCSYFVANCTTNYFKPIKLTMTCKFLKWRSTIRTSRVFPRYGVLKILSQCCSFHYT